MNLTLTIKGLAELNATVADLSDRRIGAAMATALTRTASDVRSEMRKAMPSIFDRPTPYTLNSLQVQSATAAQSVARVYFKSDRSMTGGGTPATYYLVPNVEGGKRKQKGVERALQQIGALPSGWLVVPAAGAALDAYGNVSGQQLGQIIGQLRAQPSGSGGGRGKGAQLGAVRKAGGTYFAVLPGARKGLAPGIYQREFLGRNITPILIFVRSVSNAARFNFEALAKATAAQRIGPNATEAMADQLSRLAAKQGGA